MTDDIHVDGHNDAEFERQDLASRPILLFLLALIIGCGVVALVLRGMYSYLDSYANHHEPVQSPLVQPTTANTRITVPGDIKKFPQPRLETDERREINDFREQEEETLNSYGWVDQQAGVVRIPIDRAIQLIAERGLPTRPQSGAVPPSDVNTAKPAAKRSDKSNAPSKPK